MGILRSIGLVILTVVVTIFFIQNLASTEVAFLTWSISAPRALVYVIVFAAGWTIALLVNALRPRPKPPVAASAAPPPSHAPIREPE